MMRNTLYAFLFFLFAISLNADDTGTTSSPNWRECECGCQCTAPCECGCMQGLACVCSDDNCPCGCSCPAPCGCGCEQGGVCDCSDGSPSALKMEQYPISCSMPESACIHDDCLCNCSTDRYRYWKCAHCVYQGPYECLDGDCEHAFGCGLYGVWIPDDCPIFRPFVADPRQVTYSAGWRWNDQALTKDVIPVSFGDNFCLYRWCCVSPWGGMLDINIEGALWAVFDPCTDSAPLINADYYVGFPINYAIGRWAFRLRGYHISSHIGDEFLLNHPCFDRRNPSAEYIDFFASYYLLQDMRFYGGMGWVIQHDDSFNSGNYYLQGGAELRLYELGFYNKCQHLFGHPFFGMDFQFWNHHEKHINSTFVAGYEWGKTVGTCKRVRLFLEYHDGYSVEGQFSKYHDNYLSARISYGY